MGAIIKRVIARADVRSARGDLRRLPRLPGGRQVASAPRNDNIMKHIITSTTQMQIFARQIARSLKGGEILLLQGELGSGKTTFTKALARALGIKKTVVSPTFTLCHEYRIKNSELRIKNLLHLDCYRLKTPEEFMHLGALEHIGNPNTITVIEWPEKVKKYLPRKGRIVLQFSHGKKKNERAVKAGDRTPNTGPASFTQ